jgi:hypothetical protein
MSGSIGIQGFTDLEGDPGTAADAATLRNRVDTAEQCRIFAECFTTWSPRTRRPTWTDFTSALKDHQVSV